MIKEDLDQAILDVKLRLAAEDGYSAKFMSNQFMVSLERAASVYWHTQNDLRAKRTQTAGPKVQWHKG